MSDARFIETLAPVLFSDKDLEHIISKLEAGEDASLGVGQSARSLLVASYAALHERPVLYVVSGEEAAIYAARTLTAWLGGSRVFHYPCLNEHLFSAKKAASATSVASATSPTSAGTAEAFGTIGQRTQALAALAGGKNVVVVCSARALMRRLPPVGTRFFQSITLYKGEEIPFEQVPKDLLGMGYVNTGEVQRPGEFRVHGDTIDVFPAQATHPVRFEYFGDEIDRIRSMVAGTNQTIADMTEMEILPAAEYALTPDTIAHAKKQLWEAAQDDPEIAADLEAIEAGIPNGRTQRYLGALYGDTASPLDHIAPSTLLVLNEPRALFDDCLRAAEEMESAARAAHVSQEDLAALFTPLRQMTFEGFQRWDLSALIRANTRVDAELVTRVPHIAGSHERLIGRLRQFANENFRIAFAVPDKGARDHLEETLLDEHIAFEHATDATSQKLQRGIVTFFSDPIPSGTIIPSVKLAIFSIGDLTQRHAKRNRRTRIDVTKITFPFKPGDYVVHANHGIAKFDGVVRRTLDEYERDYFLLLYADGDKLFVPLERVDYLTRYVGPDGQNPRLTRLGTADWTRATNRARKNAKKLAFDLVDLYTRRAATQGHAFSPDTAHMKEMEAAFPYELTTDQARALSEIKADMESARPMDRLLSGDVGFGKTEVALRAAYKAVQDKTQVVLLAPTTILAQQHFDTFEKRLAPFNVRVAVLSRMRTAAEQAKTLKDFAEGNVDILIGTHRLLSADVNPKNLGLVIVDEEQRFGVAAKEHLKNMREQVDVLTLSATPIPRTMQMSISGVRDMSLIMTPPTGRLPVKVVVHEYDEDTVTDAIRAEIARGGQVYYVSNRVKTIDEAMEHVCSAVPEARIGVAHGKMSPRQIEDVMLKFHNQEIDVLIATTIIESGLDNPRTNTLIIEDSQRLGLAQLYQLKGRVGRGHTQAYAYFMFPATEPLTEEATERLSAINEHQELGSGIRIAMRDLEIRGAGSLVGAEQHGNLSSVGFDLFTSMLGQAVEEAKGSVPDVAASEITINIGANYYFSEDYMSEIDKRVLAYRRVAGAAELFQLEDLREEFEKEYGPLEEAGLNLFARQALRIRAERLGVTTISYAKGKLTIDGVEVPRSVVPKLRAQGATIFPKTHKLTMGLHLKANAGVGTDVDAGGGSDMSVRGSADGGSAFSLGEGSGGKHETEMKHENEGASKTGPQRDTLKYRANENPVLQKALQILEEIGGEDEED